MNKHQTLGKLINILKSLKKTPTKHKKTTPPQTCRFLFIFSCFLIDFHRDYFPVAEEESCIFWIIRWFSSESFKEKHSLSVWILPFFLFSSQWQECLKHFDRHNIYYCWTSKKSIHISATSTSKFLQKDWECPKVTYLDAYPESRNLKAFNPVLFPTANILQGNEQWKGK